MARMRKYEKGLVQIETADEIMSAVASERYLWWNDRPYHPRWIASWSLSMIYNQLKFGRIFYAHRKENKT